MVNTSVKDDIQQYALAGLNSSEKLRNRADHDQILKALVDEAEGMILWSHLMPSEVVKEDSWRIQNMLKRPPKVSTTCMRVYCKASPDEQNASENAEKHYDCF